MTDVLVLGIETSCDETGVGVVEDRTTLRSNVVASQIELHAPYGGVVPEVAARAHLEQLLPVIDQALVEAGAGLSDVDAIAVTAGPGLIGALLVGVAAAKGLALSSGLPLVAVNHLRGHIEAAQLEHGLLRPPLGALLVSGGHTSIVSLREDGRYRELGRTLDDAVGEAYDKIARFLGLGYPGGPVIDRLAREGDPTAYRFPRAMLGDGTLDVSMSGLKTAVVRELRRREADGEVVDVADVAASFQAAIVEVLVTKTMTAVRQEGLERLVLAGGVAANSALRGELARACDADGVELLVPSVSLCTDNGAMIAAAGANRAHRGEFSDLDLPVDPNLVLAAAGPREPSSG
ncbi:tRNA (adenosine(37)-N6)-threonylcarbamoyltransferase complex transferase subunit TsaD [Nitriliruptoraceae bacterium ZYF776]|nr:tRNA (adenosine(37)-N6)-threonylcarbamoyltransferase complex transferase subunit TsaD [Profundirhabdus halotolerans]